MMPQPKNSALTVAVRLLARRDHSERELSDKLAQRAYSQDEINEALARLRERGYVDDTAYCNKLAESLWQSGKWGLSGVVNQLRRHGLPMAMIREAMAAFEHGQEFAHALTLLQKRLFSSDEREKAGRFLASRGFSFAVIEQSLDQIFPEG
jgi:regulatory protein